MINPKVLEKVDRAFGVANLLKENLLDAHIEAIHGDAVLLEHVLQNLMHNFENSRLELSKIRYCISQEVENE